MASFQTRTTYFSIHYNNTLEMEKFYDSIWLPRKLRKEMEVLEMDKLDYLVEKVQTLLGLEYKEGLLFELVLYDSPKEITKVCQEIYDKDIYSVAFCERSGIMHACVENISLKVFAHELGHLLLERYFPTFPHLPHEWVAQGVERNII